MITKLYVNKLKRDLRRLAVMSLITVVVWLLFSTYRVLTRPQVKPDVKKQLTPLTASLDLDTMDQVKTRLVTPAIDWNSLGQTAPVFVVSEATESASVAAQINQ